MRLKGLLKNSNSRRTTIVSVTPNQMDGAYYFLLQISPAVNHGLREFGGEGDQRHVLIEVALISYLIGMGFDYRTARTVVDSWESDETLLNEGVLIGAEGPNNLTQK